MFLWDFQLYGEFLYIVSSKNEKRDMDQSHFIARDRLKSVLYDSLAIFGFIINSDLVRHNEHV